MEENIIISLGGSLIMPDTLDVDFLKEFKTLILTHVTAGKKFVIITGGGKICRRYQDAARQLSRVSDEDLDWIGIASLKLNAELIRVMFEAQAHDRVIPNLSTHISFERPIIIGSAYEPGQSTDWDAVLAAKNLGAKTIINLSNTDYVYSADPRTNPNAKKFEKISWVEYRNLIPKEWNPGLSSPFDPVASELAEKENIRVVIMNGKPIDNLKNFLDGKEFLGTTIS